MTHFIIKLYSFLLGLFPVSFRSEFREQMLLDFSDMAADAEAKGRSSLIRFCIRELLDFPVNLLHVHMKENRMLKILRFKPLNFGLRGAVGFGTVYALTFPVVDFMYDKLSCIDTFVARLQVSYYDQYHVEKSFELISRIPYLLSLLITGLLLGCVFAFLFAERSQYSKYILTGALGWGLINLMGWALAFNFLVFLTVTQNTYFGYMMFVLSGAMWGLIIAVLKSERRDAVRWLAGCLLAYPLFAYLWVKGLFALFMFQTPWRFVGVAALFVVLVTGVIVLAQKLVDKQGITWVVTGIMGYLLCIPLTYFAGAVLYPPMVSLNTVLDHLSVTVSNIIYGGLLGLFLGVVIGIQGKQDSQQVVA